MGYSIYVVTKNKELATKMVKHLRSTIKDDWIPNAQVATNFESSRLSYAQLGKDRYQVGFNYNCLGQVENALVCDIVKWMAKTMPGFVMMDANI